MRDDSWVTSDARMPCRRPLGCQRCMDPAVQGGKVGLGRTAGPGGLL